MTKNSNIAKYIHPGITAILPLWTQMRDTYAGEQAVKARGTDYLPMTDGQAADYGNGRARQPASSEGLVTGDKAQDALNRYKSYKSRAIFPNYLQDTIISMLGVMYSEKPKEIALPSALQEMAKSATPYGDSIEMLMRRINENQLITGRRGLLLEPPEKGKIPKILEYSAETILNWRIFIDSESNAQLKFILLDESGAKAEGLKWSNEISYRLCALDGAGKYYSLKLDKDSDFDAIDLDHPSADAVYPALLGQTLNSIPFTFVNACSVLPDLENPPLLALSNMCIAIYRGDADYRQHLYQQGQDTAFFKGFTEDELSVVRLGAGQSVGSTSADADFKMVGVNSQGLPEERTSQENLLNQAVNMGIALVEQKQAESGEALKTRLVVKTASMKTIALSGARGIENLLKTAAIWAGANPDEVKIEPNLDFSASAVAAKDLLDLWSTKQSGAPLSEKSYHEYLQRNNYTDLTYEQEMQEIESEGGINPTIIPQALPGMQ